MMHSRTSWKLSLRLLLVIGFVFLAERAPLRADDLDDAMATYLHAIRNGNTFDFLRLLPTDRAWRFFSYRAGTSRVVTSNAFSYEETKDNFSQRGGLYFAFFVGTDQYRYPARCSRYPLSSWIRSDNSYRLPESVGTSFVNWSKENGRWLIQAIGDDAP